VRWILEHVRESADSLAGAVSLIQRCLIERLSTVSIDARVARGVAVIDRCDGLIGIEDLAASLDMTCRHLERLFRQHVGVSPKRLARITRFQRALAVLESAGTATEILAAHACGYADQAHFIREFRELAGCAPGQHLLDRAELTGFFSSSPERLGRRERL
jgi:AraC-like DNA-binding protein